MNTIIEKIRAEVERLKGICTAQIKANPGQTFPFVMEVTGYDKLLSFLSDLEKEEKPNNPTLQEQPVKTNIVEDLKHYLATTPKEQIEKDWESLKEWGNVGPSVSEFLGWEQPVCEGLEEETEKFIETFGWGKTKHLAEKELISATARHFAKWQKEQMMKEAVEWDYTLEDGRIEFEGDPLPCLNPILNLPFSKFKPGQKVRIIVCKKED